MGVFVYEKGDLRYTNQAVTKFGRYVSNRRCCLNRLDGFKCRKENYVCKKVSSALKNIINTLQGNPLTFNDTDSMQKSDFIWPTLGWIEQENYGCDERCAKAARWANFIRRVENGEWRSAETCFDKETSSTFVKGEKPVDIHDVSSPSEFLISKFLGVEIFRNSR